MSLRVRYCHRLRDACLQGIQEREKKVLLDFYMVLLNFSRVLLDFSVVFTPSSHSFTPFFHGLPNFQMVSLDFPLFFHGLLDFSIILPFHSSLPKCTSEDGPGGNRYPTVTQLPPGT